MNDYKIVKIRDFLADLIDELVEKGEYSSRAEFVRDLIRSELRKRGLLGGKSAGH